MRGVSVEVDIVEESDRKRSEESTACSDRNIVKHPDEFDAVALALYLTTAPIQARFRQFVANAKKRV
jgi:hypothetical protein